VLEILKHDKIWGTICISVPHPKFWGTCLLSPVFYARVEDENGLTGVAAVAEVADPARVPTQEMPRVVSSITSH